MVRYTVRHFLRFIAPVTAGFALVFAIGCAGKPETRGPSAAKLVADTIYEGGDIVTINDAQPLVEALATRDGRILALGARAEIEKAHKGPATRVVNLAGHTLLPAFLDAHSHYITSLSVANQAKVYAPPAGPGKDVPSLLAAIEQFRLDRKVPRGELIQAYGYDDSVMPDGRPLNRDDLDHAFPDNPVLVVHVSMHGGVMNSAALARFGISAATSTPPGGLIQRKPGTNEPYGLVMETAFLPVLQQLPKLSSERIVELTKAGQLLYAQAGITTAQDGATRAGDLELMKRASAAGANVIDVVALPFIVDLDQVLKDSPLDTWGRYDHRLEIGGVKIVIDGSPQARTAFFTTPYLTGGPAGQADWRGETTFPQDTINRMVKRVYDLGVPLYLHANGDGAIDAFLQAHEFAAAGDLSKDRHVTLVHAQFTRKDQLDKYVEYKVRPSFFTLHTYYFYDAHVRNRGREQAQYISPMRDAIDHGLHPTNHTDFYVAPLDQMFMLWSAVNRISRSGADVGPDQRVTPLEGLKAMTLWAAEQYGEQAAKGSLEPGKLADLVILDRNPLKVEPMTIKEIKVLETIKEGTTIYARR